MITKKTLMAAAFACAVTPVAYAADIDVITALAGAPGDTLVIDGTVEIKTPSSNVDDGTAPVASLPIGNQFNTGFTTTTEPGTINQFSTNGSGEQVRTTIGNGGVIAETNGDLTLEVQETQTTTYNYTIESRQFLVSDPAGFIDAAGTYGPIGMFYANGTTLPGTQEDVATVRDLAGNLLAVLTDIPGVGPLAAVDGDGDPILTQAQINTINGSGSAPVGFEDIAAPTTDGGNLQVGGTANVDGVLSLGDSGAGAVADVAAAINGNAADIISGDAATLASANDYADTQDDSHSADDRAYADTQDDSHSAADRAYTDGEVSTERTRAIAAENALGFRITDEVNDRIAADVNLQNQINGNAGAIANNRSRINKNKSDIQTNTRGIAMVAAMTNTTVLPGNTSAIDFNLSHFEGETGFGFGYARAINPNLQLKFAVASTTDFDESVVRAGVSYQW